MDADFRQGQQEWAHPELARNR